MKKPSKLLWLILATWFAAVMCVFLFWLGVIVLIFNLIKELA